MARVKKGASVKKAKKAIQFQMGWGGFTALFISTICVLLWTFIMGFWVGQKLVGKGSISEKNLTTLNTLDEPVPEAPRVNVPRQPVEPAFPPMVAEKGQAQGVYASRGTAPAGSSGASGLEPLPTEVVGTAASQTAEQNRPEASQTVKARTKPVGKAGSMVAEVSETAGKAAGPAQKTVTAQPEKTAQSGKKVTRKEEVREQRTPKTYFVLQIASYRDRNRAEQEARRWRKKGITAQVSKVSLGKKGVWYRVYLGHYKTAKEAKAGSKRLARKEGIRSYVVPLKS